jgi:hypothetical protein
MGCRDVAQHAKRAVKAEVRFSATDPYRTLAAPFAVNRMPRSAVEEHRLRTLAGSESPWVSKYVNARTRIEEKLYRHPGRQHRTTTRRWIAREIQPPCLPRLAPFVGCCAEPQCERQIIARTIVCRAAFRAAVLVQNQGPGRNDRDHRPRCKTVYQSFAGPFARALYRSTDSCSN